jgi:hypothetical protein
MLGNGAPRRTIFEAVVEHVVGRDRREAIEVDVLGNVVDRDVGIHRGDVAEASIGAVLLAGGRDHGISCRRWHARPGPGLGVEHVHVRAAVPGDDPIRDRIVVQARIGDRDDLGIAGGGFQHRRRRIERHVPRPNLAATHGDEQASRGIDRGGRVVRNPAVGELVAVGLPGVLPRIVAMQEAAAAGALTPNRLRDRIVGGLAADRALQRRRLLHPGVAAHVEACGRQRTVSDRPHRAIAEHAQRVDRGNVLQQVVGVRRVRGPVRPPRHVRDEIGARIAQPLPAHQRQVERIDLVARVVVVAAAVHQQLAVHRIEGRAAPRAHARVQTADRGVHAVACRTGIEHIEPRVRDLVPMPGRQRGDRSEIDEVVGVRCHRGRRGRRARGDLRGESQPEDRNGRGAPRLPGTTAASTQRIDWLDCGSALHDGNPTVTPRSGAWQEYRRSARRPRPIRYHSHPSGPVAQLDRARPS